MRRLAFCAVLAALSLAAPAASAQSYRTPAYAAESGPNFSGFEIGPDLGYGFGTTGPYNISGGAAGGHVGYNFQSGPLVGGAEVDAMGANLTTAQGASFGFSTTFLSSLRAKVGYAAGAIMPYATVGIGWGSTNFTNFWGNHGEMLSGLTYGVGAEYAVTRNVSFRAEILRYQFGDVTYGGALPFETQSVNASTNMLRLGANVRF